MEEGMHQQDQQGGELGSFVGTREHTYQVVLSSTLKDDSRAEPLLTVERLRALATIVRRIKEQIRVADGDGPARAATPGGRDVECAEATCTIGSEDPADSQERGMTR